MVHEDLQAADTSLREARELLAEVVRRCLKMEDRIAQLLLEKEEL